MSEQTKEPDATDFAEILCDLFNVAERDDDPRISLSRLFVKQLAAEITRLRAERPGWRTMESAPKDGTPFLARSGNWRTVCFWHKHRRCWAVSGPAYESYPADEQPTHWQPLPALHPSVAEGRQPKGE